MTHVSGPPGTGKTRTLAELIERLCRLSQRTIVAAPTNVAVDTLAGLLNRGGALLSGLLADGKIIRVGETTPELRKQQVHLDHAFQRTAEEVSPVSPRGNRGFVVISAARSFGATSRQRTFPAMNTPGAAITSYAASSPDLPPLRAAAQLLERVTSLAEMVTAGERAAVARATVVFCTLTKLCLPGILQDTRAGTVIVDEASMVPMPAIRN